jgi:hypothetical protein
MHFLSFTDISCNHKISMQKKNKKNTREKKKETSQVPTHFLHLVLVT